MPNCHLSWLFFHVIHAQKIAGHGLPDLSMSRRKVCLNQLTEIISSMLILYINSAPL